MSNRVLIVGDLHCPWENKKGIAKIAKIAKELKPTHIIQIGDLYDMYQFSRYPKRLSITPEDELRRGRRAAKNFWLKMKKAAPKAECIQLLGNHDVRPYKSLLSKAPELESLFRINELFKFPGVITLDTSRDNYNLDEVLYHHGYLTGLGYHMTLNWSKAVVGHSHLGGVVFRRFGKKTLWELNVGHCADTDSFVFDYGESKFKNWTLGVGIVDELGPRFIPL